MRLTKIEAWGRYISGRYTYLTRCYIDQDKSFITNNVALNPRMAETYLYKGSVHQITQRGIRHLTKPL